MSLKRTLAHHGIRLIAIPTGTPGPLCPLETGPFYGVRSTRRAAGREGARLHHGVVGDAEPEAQASGEDNPRRAGSRIHAYGRSR